ncbi:MAG TPA: helix-turn-helix transcriptional regulator [Candidatus Limnocylindrales bacterium]|nr:helix-turn-helix transcriptional regulator [Candidatus Limnocylindrales bacterium]
MPDSLPSIEFARALLALKQRTGRGYRDLAGTVYVSPATLHRYCAGKALPAEFGFVRRLARLAGTRADELDSIYRLWLKAQLDSGPARQQ